MSPAEWERVQRLIEECESLPAEQVRLKLDLLADPSLAAEVSSLLALRDISEDFLERPAVESGVEGIDPWIGQVLGGYLITSLLGEGGTSRVYRAERNDGQFRKTVAIKMLKPELCDRGMRRRLRRERQILSDLNHPNIIRFLDGAMTPKGLPYIVMDLAEGVTLSQYVRDRLPSSAERLALMKQVADAVAHAHSRKIAHRDLKPSNILVTEKGEVKLLDFGIARLLDADHADGSQTQTQTRLWTPFYASPEQARGEQAGTEADLYSLGVILYELLEGDLPYLIRNASQQQMIDAICHARPRGEPHPVIARLLNKDPQRRGTADALSADLAAWPAAARRSRRWLVATLACCAAVLATISLYIWKPPVQPGFVSPVSVFEGAVAPSISPDGTKVVFIAHEGTEAYMVRVKDLSTGQMWEVGPGLHARWAPDGRRIAVIDDAGAFGSLVVYAFPGGARQELARLRSRLTRTVAVWDLIHWTPDGKEILLAETGGGSSYAIRALRVADGRWRQLTNPPAGHLGDAVGAMSPDGETLAFVRLQSADSGDVYVLHNGVERRLTWNLTTTDGIDWTPAGDAILYSARRGTAGARLWRVPFPGPGEPALAVDLDGDLVVPSITRLPNGKQRLAFHQRIRDINLWMGSTGDASIDRTITPPSIIAEDLCGDVSPDGTKVVYSTDRGGTFDIWVADLRDGSQRQLTSMGGPYTDSPGWSPDGTVVAFTSAHGSNRDIFIVPSNGGSARRFTADASEEGRPSWSRDGRWLYFRSSRSGSAQIWRQRADASGQPERLTRLGGYQGIEASDGRSLYYVRSRTSGDVWNLPLDGSPERLVLREGSENQYGAKHWAVASGAVYFLSNLLHSNIRAVKRVSFPTLVSDQVRTIVPKGQIGCLRLTADGNRMLWTQNDRNEDQIRVADID